MKKGHLETSVGHSYSFREIVKKNKPLGGNLERTSFRRQIDLNDFLVRKKSKSSLA